MPFEDVVWALADMDSRADQIRLYRDYYEGRHRQVIPESKTLNRTVRDLIQRLRDNLCDDVVDESVSRTSITTWTGPTTAVSTTATDTWKANKGPSRAKEVHRDHWAIGDAFVIVQRDTQQRPRFYPQRPELMAIRYSDDEPDKAEVAAKCWRAGKRWRLTLYYPGEDGRSPRVERYATKGTGPDGARPQAKAFDLVTESMGFGPPVETLEGTRFPVYHAPAGEVGRYGHSVLTGVVPLQDLLNKSLADMVVLMEDTALPLRHATGIQAEIDPTTGQEKPLFKSGTERMLRTASPEARFGQFPQTSLQPFLEVQDKTRVSIGREGYLPPHALNLSGTAQAPSGISLLVNEGRQVKRVKSAEDDVLEPFWREVMAHMLDLAGVAVEPSQIDVEWAPVATRDEQALVEILSTKVRELGLPKRQALIEDGYDEKDVDEWLDDAQAAADAISGGRMSPAGPPSTQTPRPVLLPPPPASPGGAPESGVGA